MPPAVRRISDILPWSLYSDGPLSSRPQPLGSGGDAAPCEDTREDFGLSLQLPATTFCCRVAFECQAYEGQTVSGQGHIWGSRCGKKRHLALQGRVSLRLPAVPMRGVRRCSCSGVAVPSLDPGTRLQEQRSGVTTQARRTLPARATNPRTGGHRPQKRPLTTGIPMGHFLIWPASSGMPHWCPT